jgi:hypothetical protein
VVSAAGENVGDLVMGGKEALNLPRRLEPLHDPLSSSGRLMGIFGPVIEALVLPMLDPGHDLPLGSGVAPQLVGDEHTRCSTLPLEEFAEQAFGGLLVAASLDENIENEAVLVDGTPEPMLLPGEADDDLASRPGGISPPGAPRTVREPLDSHGSRCSAADERLGHAPELLPLPVGSRSWLSNAVPSVQFHYRPFNPTTDRSAPVPRIGTLVLAVSAAWTSPFTSGRQVLTFHTRA